MYVVICCIASKPEASVQDSRPNPHRNKIFRFQPTMHLDFLTAIQRIVTTILCPPIAFICLIRYVLIEYTIFNQFVSLTRRKHSLTY